jgi:hypothetical protein
MNSDFSIPDALGEAMDRASADGTPLYELGRTKNKLIDDLSVVPDDTEYVAIKGSAKNLDRLAQLNDIVAIWASEPTNKFFQTSARLPRLRALYVVYFKTLDEVQLSGAKSLEHLALSWATRLQDLSFLRDLPALKTLIIDDMKRLDLTTLPELPQLTGLALGGGINSTMKVQSFDPLTRLPNLRYLSLYSIRSTDGSLKPLSMLRNLRDIALPNYFSVDEFARLAGALPDTKGKVLTPFFTATDGSDKIPWGCKNCGGPRYMMTGKPAVILCPECDKAKMDKRIARWEAARASRWPA